MISFIQLATVPSTETSGELSLANRQRERDELFPARVAQSPFRLWWPEQDFEIHGLRLLIGVATWSRADLELLDMLASELAVFRDGISVDVFNVASCTSHDSFSQYIPGLGLVYQTPVAGLWRDGVLREKGSGKAARALIDQVRDSLPRNAHTTGRTPVSINE